MKSTPSRGVKEYLKPYTYKLSEDYSGVYFAMSDGVPFA